MHKNKFFADISLLFVAFIWGSTFVVVQNAISFLEPLTFNAIRFFIASILLWLWLIFFQRKQLSLINQKLILAGCILGFWLFIGYAFQTIGLLYTTSSKAGFITGLSVVLVPLFSWLFFKLKLTPFAIAGISIATIGLYLLTMTGPVGVNIGDVFVFICAIGFSFHIICTGQYTKLYPALLLTVIQITTVTFLSFICSFLFERWELAFQINVLFKSDVILAILITSIFATALSFFIQTYVQKYTSPSHTALIFAMEPVFAALTAYLWVGERLHIAGLIGCICIFVGMVFSEIPWKKKGKSSLTLT